MDRTKGKAEQKKEMEISTIVNETGVMYFEYDPVHHVVTRPEKVAQDAWEDRLENFPDSYIRQSQLQEKQAELMRTAFQRIDQGSAHEFFTIQTKYAGKYTWLEYNLVAVSPIRVACIATDVSEVQFEQSIEKILLKKQFDGISLIDTVEKTFLIRYFKQLPELENAIWQDYEMSSLTAAGKYLTASERTQFLEKTSLQVILEHLEKSECYTFIMEGIDGQNNLQRYRYSYYYLDSTRRLILSTLEDITVLVDYDVLTGEYNRDGFIRFVEGFLNRCEDRKQYAILFFNIKGFKAINDLVGVEGGDQILKELSLTIRESALQPIALSRFEADHFVVFMDRKNLDYEVIDKLCRRTVEMNGKTFHFYGRCGIYPLNDTKHNVSGMCDRAKMAKQFITDDYVKPYAVYDQTMRKTFMKKKELLSDLEHGVRNKEFEVYYQPIYHLQSGKIVSAEALVRWVHPEYGVVSPGEFISVFEENGFISQLDMLVESRAKEFLKERLEKGLPIVPIAINLSRMDFYDTLLMDKILRDVKELSQNIGYCRLEITESAYSALVDHAADYIHQFKEAGIKILLDDFGSGYSSFSTIREFDFDVLKLDIGFIQQIGQNKKVECIISNMIQMAHELGLEVIAEGVETEYQREFLIEKGCDYAQGYLYARPLPKPEFLKLIDAF